jgi:DNA-binding NtrC family response regulator
VEATKHGATAFLEKPITLQKLLRAVEQALMKPVHRLAEGLPGAVAHPLAGASPEPAFNGGAHHTHLLPVVAGPRAEQSFDLDRPLREARDAFEKSYFEFHLAKEGGSMTRVAERTGLERTHLYRKLKQLGVDLTRGKRGLA